MFANITEAVKTLKKPGKTSVNLRLRLQLYLFLFIIVIFGIIIVFAVVFDVFSAHKSASSTLALQLDRYEHRLKSYFNNTAAQGIHFSQQVAKEIDKILEERGVEFSDVSDNQNLIAELERSTYSLLYDSLRIADCSGSFIVLDATVNTKLPEAKHSRAGTYLKLANVNTSKPVSPMVLWARGIHEIGHDHNHIFHNKWQLEFDTSCMKFYEFILENATKNLLECYYYSPALPFAGTWEKAMLLCVPIVGKSGQVYGICGLEINSIYFKLLHMEAGTHFKRAMGLVAQKDGNAIQLETGLEFGTKDGYYAGLGEGQLTVTRLDDLQHYRLNANAKNAGKELVGLHRKISLSPLSDKQDAASWVVACMIPKEDYDFIIYFSYLKLILFCVTFFAITIILTYYISRRYNLPILQGIHAIKKGSLQKTYINEIDDLMEFLAANDTVQDVNMSAFYEFKKNVKKLSRAETAVFCLYMEGYSAAKIAETLFVSINTIKSHNKNIYRKLNVSSRKELMVYAQMMKTSD